MYCNRRVIRFPMNSDKAVSLVTYIGAARLKSSLGHRLSWPRFIVGFSILPGKCHYSVSITPRPLPSKYFKFIYQPFNYYCSFSSVFM